MEAGYTGCICNLKGATTHTCMASAGEHTLTVLFTSFIFQHMYMYQGQTDISLLVSLLCILGIIGQVCRVAPVQANAVPIHLCKTHTYVNFTQAVTFFITGQQQQGETNAQIARNSKDQKLHHKVVPPIVAIVKQQLSLPLKDKPKTTWTWSLEEIKSFCP